MAQKPPPSGYDPFGFFGEMSKMLERANLPRVDVAALMEMHRKDLEALTEANRLALASLQSVPAKYAEQLQGQFAKLQALSAQAGSNNAGTADPAKLVQETMQQALGNMQELAESAGKSQTEAYEVLVARVRERVEELQAMMAPKKG